MMTEIIRQLTTIKKTNEITSDHVQFWLNEVRHKKKQKTIPEETKESKVSDAVKRNGQQNNGPRCS